MNEGLITGGVYVDLKHVKKAFDTVNHHTVLKTMLLFSIADTDHLWFKDYLNNTIENNVYE